MEKLRALTFIVLLTLSGFSFANAEFKSRESDIIITQGGTEAEASKLAIEKCQEIFKNKIINSTKLLNEQPIIFSGTRRMLQCTLTFNQPRPPSAERKILQTRKFSKSKDSILKAMKEWMSDDYPNYAPQFTYAAARNNFLFAHKVSDLTSLIYDIEFVVDESDKDNTVIRTRIYNTVKTAEREIFDPELYKDIFSKMSQHFSSEAQEIK